MLFRQCIVAYPMNKLRLGTWWQKDTEFLIVSVILCPGMEVCLLLAGAMLHAWYNLTYTEWPCDDEHPHTLAFNPAQQFLETTRVLTLAPLQAL